MIDLAPPAIIQPAPPELVDVRGHSLRKRPAILPGFPLPLGGKGVPAVNGTPAVRASGSWTSTTSNTQNFTPPAGTNKLIMICGWRAAAAARTTTLTWNGVAANELLDVQQTNRPGISIYEVDNPTVGVAADAVLTFSGNTVGAVCVIPIRDADLSLTPAIQSVGSNSATSLGSATWTVSRSNALMLCIGNWVDASTAENRFTITGDAGWSEVLERGASSSGCCFVIGQLRPTLAPSVSLTVNAVTSATYCLLATVEIA